MEKLERMDIWNSNKLWILKKSKCHHYYVGQCVGKIYYPPKRVRKSLYTSILENLV